MDTDQGTNSTAIGDVSQGVESRYRVVPPCPFSARGGSVDERIVFHSSCKPQESISVC